MYYFGRIIGAFFNQLFRFLFWNKFGQKLLIAIIIILIAIWCVGMTEVHAVEEVEDINYEVKSYYDGIVNEFILRLDKSWDTLSDNTKENLLDPRYNYYIYTGYEDGSSYNNARPLNFNTIRATQILDNIVNTGTITNYDYIGVTGYTMYSFTKVTGYDININNNVTYFTNRNVSIPLFVFTYTPQNWKDYVLAKRNNDVATITALLEDIKAEQQATNDFLTEEQDDSLMDIQTPTYTDSASESMSSNLHDSINSLTTQMQTTVSNYYEGWDAYSWVIPLPQFIGGNITFDSGVTRKIIGTSGVLYNLIQAVWVILFGGYIIGFIKRMLDWVQTGKIFDEGGLSDFIWWMDTNNEIIKASMM